MTELQYIAKCIRKFIIEIKLFENHVLVLIAVIHMVVAVGYTYFQIITGYFVYDKCSLLY